MSRSFAGRFVLLPVCAALLLTLLFFRQLVFTDHILGRGDTYTYFYPYWTARDAALREGRLPLWTTDIFGGAPLLADPQLGTFYPPNWLTVGLSAPDAVRISILLHIGLALLGAYWLARRTLGVTFMPALVAGAIFALGGYVSSHVEQINQLQGLAWMPLAFLLLHEAVRRPQRYLPLLGMVLALQLLTGHTQTVFITGVGLGLYALFLPPPQMPAALAERLGAVPRPLRRIIPIGITVLLLLIATGIGAALASAQLIPTFELTAVSNRAGGLNPQQAVAFSFNPLLMGRGLLPSYDAQIVGEYVGYVGVIGTMLAVWGIFGAHRSVNGRLRWAWLVIALVGLTFAFGLYNPLYWALASLPGFNAFRVPSRWLALFTLGAALLAALGLGALKDGKRPTWRPLVVSILLIGGLAGISLLTERAPENFTDPARPTPISFVLWAAAAIMTLALLWLPRWARGRSALLLVLLIGELCFAALALPYNTLVPPEVFHTARFTLDQLAVYNENVIPPERTLSITELLFDPGDVATLEARYRALGMSDLAIRHALVGAKLKESLAPNLSLVWGLPSIDGFGGGLLPTVYYTQFSGLLLPPDTLRTVDGRLRENLALPTPQCRGACIPEDRWLNLLGVRYLITDKVRDLNYESIFYDTTFRVQLQMRDQITLGDLPPFETTRVDLLLTSERADPTLAATFATADDVTMPFSAPVTSLDGLSLVRYSLPIADAPETLTIASYEPVTVHAVTLVDTRTGTFVQLVPNSNWRRVLSSDIKLYENQAALPRALVLHDVEFVPDDYTGTEIALGIMRGANFDPARTVILSGVGESRFDAATYPSAATITEYTAERVRVEVQAARAGYLLLTDSYFLGWTAAVNGVQTPIFRADVLFRAVQVPAGSSTVVFSYAPVWYPGSIIVALLAWGMLGGYLTGQWRRAEMSIL